MRTGRPRESMVERFWMKVRKTKRCWLWSGAEHDFGYGRLNKPGRGNGYIHAHRFAWTLAYGSIPNDMCVCHRCDNPRCVRPSHLFLGTLSDNTLDMIAKGRHAKQKTLV